MKLFKMAAVIVALIAGGAVGFEAWFLGSHKLTVAEMLQSIAATAAVVSALGGLLSAAGKAKDTAQLVEQAAERATEALSRSMLPDSIDLQLRIESWAPRTVLVNVNTDQMGWRMSRIVRKGADGDEVARRRAEEVLDVREFNLPDGLQTNRDFGRWLTLLDIEVRDVRNLVRWRVHGQEQNLTRPARPEDALDTLDATILYFAVQERAVKMTASAGETPSS